MVLADTETFFAAKAASQADMKTTSSLPHEQNEVKGQSADDEPTTPRDLSHDTDKVAPQYETSECKEFEDLTPDMGNLALASPGSQTFVPPQSELHSETNATGHGDHVSCVTESATSVETNAPTPSTILRLSDTAQSLLLVLRRGCRQFLSGGTTREVLDPAAMISFPMSFLTTILGANDRQIGFHFPISSPMTSAKGYYLASRDLEAFLPAQPGADGLRLLPIINDDADIVTDAQESDQHSAYCRSHLFISIGPQEGEDEEHFIYYGDYNQPRFSDTLSYAEQLHFPADLKRYWAQQLTSPTRPSWVTRVLRDHFFPKPSYEEPMPVVRTDGTRANDAEMDVAWHAYKSELSDWQRDSQRDVEALREEDILESFEQPDAGFPPGMRMYWEYLQCVGFDRNFYYAMASAFQQRDGQPSEDVAQDIGPSLDGAEDLGLEEKRSSCEEDAWSFVEDQPPSEEVQPSFEEDQPSSESARPSFEEERPSIDEAEQW
ncbi:hypothetical protein MRB53_041626 [Persea americana]|nr:hypothetical protein MRB53_041626 [Persea americana]